MTSPSVKSPIQSAPGQTKDLVLFVRQGLGCGCPDEVFSDIRIEPRPKSFEGLPVDCLMKIGGRLMIAVCSSTEWQKLKKNQHGV